MSSENTIQYSFRLNLKNPDHLLIHQTLMNLNPDVYCSMSMYMIDCILKDIKGHGQNLQDIDSGKKWYVTRNEISGLSEIIKKDIKNDLTDYFMKMFLGILSQSGLKIGKGTENMVKNE